MTMYVYMDECVEVSVRVCACRESRGGAVWSRRGRACSGWEMEKEKSKHGCFCNFISEWKLLNNF